MLHTAGHPAASRSRISLCSASDKPGNRTVRKSQHRSAGKLRHAAPTVRRSSCQTASFSVSPVIAAASSVQAALPKRPKTMSAKAWTASSAEAPAATLACTCSFATSKSLLSEPTSPASTSRSGCQANKPSAELSALSFSSLAAFSASAFSEPSLVPIQMLRPVIFRALASGSHASSIRSCSPAQSSENGRACNARQPSRASAPGSGASKSAASSSFFAVASRFKPSLSSRFIPLPCRVNAANASLAPYQSAHMEAVHPPGPVTPTSALAERSNSQASRLFTSANNISGVQPEAFEQSGLHPRSSASFSGVRPPSPSNGHDFFMQAQMSEWLGRNIT
mmetsp:Transcript_8845/g.20701  ORF Transcript_8845/g.20701 Transcript_8845/m.20701 type:complete len:337 (+) Transcript_8845:492-1502(+)